MFLGKIVEHLIDTGNSSDVTFWVPEVDNECWGTQLFRPRYSMIRIRAATGIMMTEPGQSPVTHPKILRRDNRQTLPGRRAREVRFPTLKGGYMPKLVEPDEYHAFECLALVGTAREMVKWPTHGIRQPRQTFYGSRVVYVTNDQVQQAIRVLFEEGLQNEEVMVTELDRLDLQFMAEQSRLAMVATLVTCLELYQDLPGRAVFSQWTVSHDRFVYH